MKKIISPIQMNRLMTVINFKREYERRRNENLEKQKVSDIYARLESLYITLASKIENIDKIIESKISLLQGKPGEPGKSPDVNEIAEIVYKRIEPPKAGEPGQTPVKGIHYFTPEDKKEVAELAASFVRLSLEQKEIDPMKIIEAIQKMPEGKRIPSRLIDGFDQTIRAIKNQTTRGYLHGGGDSIVAGTGIVLTVNNNGTKTIATTGGTLTEEIASGLINGSNQVYTTIHQPKQVLYGSTLMRMTGSGADVTVTGSGPYTITFNNIAPTGAANSVWTYY